ncbi:MAG: hypothetical protein Q9N34_02780 [Aquificota bacterium]|nr:hypothetical protein [Aquificota bacterium]
MTKGWRKPYSSIPEIIYMSDIVIKDAFRSVRKLFDIPITNPPLGHNLKRVRPQEDL